jgi:trimethylamine--corrinoid protein Co-methyltransferase
MQSDHVYPLTGNRFSPKEWDEKGKPDLLMTATAKKDAILARRAPARFDPAVDAAIRAQFRIYLPV